MDGAGGQARERNPPLERQLQDGKPGLIPEPPKSRTGAFLGRRVWDGDAARGAGQAATQGSAHP